MSRSDPILPSIHWRQEALRAAPSITEEQIILLARYRDLILESNAHFNLTAIRDPDGVDYRLILESLRLAPYIQQSASAMASPVTLIDIGTGAGIPGVPLGVIFPEIAVSLIDATAKKVRFIDRAIAALELVNCRAIHGRAEELGHDPLWRESQDLAVARAVGPLAALLELSMPLLRPGGRAIFPKGMLRMEEIDAAQRAAPLLGTELAPIATLEQVEGCPVTQVAQADKMSPIADQYPRRPGLSARDPLGG